MAQFGSASALGAEGRRFKSCYPDHVMSQNIVFTPVAFGAGVFASSHRSLFGLACPTILSWSGLVCGIFTSRDVTKGRGSGQVRGVFPLACNRNPSCLAGCGREPLASGGVWAGTPRVGVLRSRSYCRYTIRSCGDFCVPASMCHLHWEGCGKGEGFWSGARGISPRL